MWRDELIHASREDLIECIMEQRHIIEHLERRIIQLELCSSKNVMYHEERARFVDDKFTGKFTGKEHFGRQCATCRGLPSMCNYNKEYYNNNISTTNTIEDNKNYINTSKSSTPLHSYREESVHKQSNKELQNVGRYSVDNHRTNREICDYRCNKNNHNINSNITTPNPSSHVYNIHKYTEELDVVDGIKEIERVLRLHNAGTPRLPNGVVAELLYIRRKLRESGSAKNNNNENVCEIEEAMQESNFCDSGAVDIDNGQHTSQVNENDSNSKKYKTSNSSNVCNVEHRLSFRTPVNSREFITLHRPRTNVWASPNKHSEEKCKQQQHHHEELQQRRSLFVNIPYNKHLNSNSSHTKEHKISTVY